MIEQWIATLPTWSLWVLILVFLWVLSKGADLLVEEAVALSLRWGVPPIVIGATIVSLGTTLPETAVSVAAAVSGNPGLALGNAVGSIICDTGLILGLVIFLGRIPIDRSVVNRQGWLQIGSGVLLVAMTIPWLAPGSVFKSGGTLPQWAGFLFVGLLGLYIYKTLQWSRADRTPVAVEAHDHSPTWLVAVKLVVGITLVIVSSKVLIPSVGTTAERLGIPQPVIAATLIAFGTSLPELVTAVAAVRRGQGGLALGNIIGADILNVLFVSGVAAAVTPAGLYAEPRFFYLLFPAMLGVLIVFRLAVACCREYLSRWAGFVLLTIYGVVSLLAYLF
jgi:cation:H+ antiporter